MIPISLKPGRMFHVNMLATNAKTDDARRIN